MAVRGHLRGHRHTRPGRAVAAVFAAFLLSASFLTVQAHPESNDAGSPAPLTDEAAVHALDSVEGYFIENRGQVADNVRYYSRGNPSVGFRDDGVMFVIRESSGGGSKETWQGPSDHSAVLGEATTVRSFAYMLRFEGAEKVEPIGIDRLSFNSNFFIGNDSSVWRTDVPNYGEVVYYGLYEGIDLVYRAGETGVKYEFIVSPGASQEAIMMSYEGIESLQADAAGLSIHTPLGEMRDSAPLAYQGSSQLIDCGFVKRRAFSYGFSCGDWDRSRPLTIDPLIYATFIGGSNYDSASVAVDEAGNAYVTGVTYSADFPVTPGAIFGSLSGPKDAFVAKLDVTGSVLLYATYLGGTTSNDTANSIAVDSSGCAYVTGYTRSPDFPTTPGAFDRIMNSMDAFVVKLNITGNALEYSTFLGGLVNDQGRGIAVDRDGHAFVVGQSGSADFPVTADAWDSTFNGNVDAFVAKLNPTGSGIEYATYIGGTKSENGVWIALDASANMYVTGWTMSSDFPVTSGAFDTFLSGSEDAFAAKLNSTGELAYATFIGGSSRDDGNSVTVDSFGNAYVTGTTNSTDFPVTPGAFDTSYNGGWDTFIIELNAVGSALVFATYLGGSGSDNGVVVLDDVGNAYVAGSTGSVNFPITAGAIDTGLNGSSDVFLSVLTPSGDNLVYSTYLGGDDSDYDGSVALDAAGAVYLAGETFSPNFPVTPGAFDTNLKGPDGFVAKLTVPVPPGVADLAVSPSDIVLSPLPPYEDGMAVQLNATIHNIGGNYTQSTSARFEDGIPPSPRIGAEQPLPPIPAGGSRNVSVLWTASPQGVHQICVVADPDNIVAETDEANNIACVPAAVLSPPDLVPVNLGVSPPSPLQDMTVAQVNVTVRNEGGLPSGGFDALFFDDVNANGLPDGGESIGSVPLSGLIGHSQVNVSVPWTATPLGSHRICAYTDPTPGAVNESNETNNVMCNDVLVQPGPVLRPDYVPDSPIPLPPIRVGMSSPVSLSIEVFNQGDSTATDDAAVAFYEQSSPPFSTFVLTPLAPAATSSRFTATWTSPAVPGTYHVSVDVDHDNNVSEWDETNNVYTWTIEVVSGPVTSLVIGNPNYTSTATYVKSSTPLDFSVLDQSGLGIRNTTYRIDGGAPVNYTATGTFFLAGEGEHTVEWRSLDWAGNLEDVSSMVLTVDDTPPATTITQSETETTTETIFTLTAADSGCGVNVTMYRIDGGGWTVYTGGFTLAEGEHTIYYYSIDNLGNVEQERSLVVRPEVAVNYKPVVALLFAIILAVVGLWSSKRKPWKGGKDRMAVMKAFMLTSMPFVFAEAGTGVVSLLTGQLSMPPPFGAGTVLDATILVAGLSVALVRAMRTRQPPT